jgi:acyl carrier protein
MSEILEKIVEICNDIYDNESEIITENTNFRSLNKWDSLTHINLVMALERAFKIKFDLQELTKLSSPEEIANILEVHK